MIDDDLDDVGYSPNPSKIKICPLQGRQVSLATHAAWICHHLLLTFFPWMFPQIFFRKFLEGIKVNVGGESPKDHQIDLVASKVELDFRFDINNLKYPDIHMQGAYNSYLRLWTPRPWWPPNCFKGLKVKI